MVAPKNSIETRRVQGEKEIKVIKNVSSLPHPFSDYDGMFVMMYLKQKPHQKKIPLGFSAEFIKESETMENQAFKAPMLIFKL